MERHYITGLIVPGAVITFVGALVLYGGLNASANRDADIRNAQENGGEALQMTVERHQYDGLITTIGIAHLAVGLPLLTIGILTPRQVNVPDRRPALTFAPMAGRDRVGGTFAIRF